MKGFILAGALGLLALLLAIVVFQVAGQVVGPSSLDYARQQAALDQLAREAARAEALAPVDLLVSAAWRLLPLLIVLAFLCYLGALGVAHLARFRGERRPDSAGRLPVAVQQLGHVAPAALAAFHHARVEEARRPLVPHSLSYAPRLDYRADAGGTAVAPAGELPAPGAAASVPSFGELLTAGRVGRGAPLLLGFEAESGTELVGSWTDLYATATAGLPGSGKTTSQRFFACQTALHGARFVVCDPHAGAADDSLAATLAPLRSCFLVEPAESPRDILAAVRYVAELGEARVRGRDGDTTPIILWVDELTGLLGRSDVGDELAGLLERIAQEYRKRFVYLSASGQIWTAARATSELRDSLASVLCHRMKRSQARLLLPTEEAATVERLATGEAILWRTSGQTSRVHIPNTTAGDVARVGELLAGHTSPAAAPAAPPAERRIGFHAAVGGGASGGAPGGAPHAPHRAQQDAANFTAEEARIVAGFLDGKSLSDLAAELNGGKKSGDGFNQAARRVADVLRRALGQKGVTA